MTRFERLAAPWLAATLGAAFALLLGAWLDHDPRKGGWWKTPDRDTEAHTAGPDAAGAVVEGNDESAPRAKGARKGRDHRVSPAAPDGGRH